MLMDLQRSQKLPLCSQAYLSAFYALDCFCSMLLWRHIVLAELFVSLQTGRVCGLCLRHAQPGAGWRAMQQVSSSSHRLSLLTLSFRMRKPALLPAGPGMCHAGPPYADEG